MKILNEILQVHMFIKNINLNDVRQKYSKQSLNMVSSKPQNDLISKNRSLSSSRSEFTDCLTTVLCHTFSRHLLRIGRKSRGLCRRMPASQHQQSG